MENKNNNPQQVQGQNIEQQQSQINMAELWFKMLDKWYIFAIAIIIALILAFFVTRYSTPKYEATSTLLIKTNNDMLNNLDMNKMMFNNNQQVDFQNAIGTIQSFTMVKRTLKAMELYCSYYQRVNFKDVDLYKDSPFEIILDQNTPQATGVKINVKLLNNRTCELSYKSKNNVPKYDYVEDDLLPKRISVKERDTKVRYGDWYSLDGMRFKILLKDGKYNPNLAKLDYSFTINDFNALASQFNSTKIDLINKESSIVSIKFKHQNPREAVDFVNMLCKIYIDMTFEEKNYLNVATINFVDTQIGVISDSLNKAEAQKESFQESHNTLNLTNDASYLYGKTNDLQTKKAEEYTKQQYYNYLTNYIETADIDAGIASPTAMGVIDPTLNGLVESLSKAVLEHKTAINKRTEKNPKTKELQITITTLRKQIAESLKSIKTASNITQRELQRQQNQLQIEVDKLPSTQRNMVNLERQFKFNDEIYTFLYQKRSDAEIAKNAALPDHKVIDKAIAAEKVYPKTGMNFLIAILLGLLLPGLYIFIRYITKDTIDSKDDLTKISDNPILGYIPEFPPEYNRMIVFDKPKSQITEAFRTIRTNIKYVLGSKEGDKEGKTILVTSSMPREGKSLMSFNVASVFSITNNRTLLVEYDLRKPRLYKMLGLNANVGITTYYIGQSSIDEIIQHTEFENLDAICVGPIPPNPSEIIDSERNKDLIKQLRQRYDFIILDTPPVSLIADAQTLAKDADINLFVVRLGRTSRSILNIAMAELEQRSNVKINFILNGVETAMQKYGYGYGKGYGGYGYGYGYGYGKGYGYGYGHGYGYGQGYGYGYFDDEGMELKRRKKKTNK